MWDVPEGFIVDPRDVMHKDLADFYMQAVVATKLSRCTPFYRLHGFGECKVSNVNVLWVRMFALLLFSFVLVCCCTQQLAAVKLAGTLPRLTLYLTFENPSKPSLWKITKLLGPALSVA